MQPSFTQSFKFVVSPHFEIGLIGLDISKLDSTLESQMNINRLAMNWNTTSEIDSERTDTEK
jgi:hypothetical protein